MSTVKTGDYFRSFDYLLLLTSLALVAYGIILIYSGSLGSYGSSSRALADPVARQIIFAAIGVTVMLLLSRIDYRILGYTAPILYALAIGSLLFVLVFANETYGSRRWIEVAGTQVQPSELTKLVLIIVLAKYFTDRQEKMTSPATFATSLAMTLLPMLLVFIEPEPWFSDYPARHLVRDGYRGGDTLIVARAGAGDDGAGGVAVRPHRHDQRLPAGAHRDVHRSCEGPVGLRV